MSAPPNQDDMLAQFTDVTGAEPERARFFLEMTNWQLPVALASFFESNDMESDSEGVPGPGGPSVLQSNPVNSAVNVDMDDTAATRAALQQGLQSLLANMTSGASSVASLPAAKPKDPKPAKQQNSSRGGPVTLDSLRNRRNSDAESSDDDDDQKQAFYAGGSQSSGQQVLGPPKKRDELVAEMFKKAREHGAQEVSVPPSGGGGGPNFITKKQSGHFSGTGYKLGEKENDTEMVGGPSSSSGDADDGSRQVVLRLWSTGFTVDGGELRSYQDPANIDFLNDVKRGEVPSELIRDYRGKEVQLTMEDRRTEDYVPPKHVTRAFSGQGQMLGSPAPATIGSTASVTEDDKRANETAARNSIPLREGEAVTNIQFRLMDGTRLVAQFNPSHTVNDLHSYINTARPQFAASNFALTLFPNKELSEKDQTIKEANLFNSALIQKMKR